jgi:hypothetical protein
MIGSSLNPAAPISPFDATLERCRLTSSGGWHEGCLTVDDKTQRGFAMLRNDALPALTIVLLIWGCGSDSNRHEEPSNAGGASGSAGTGGVAGTSGTAGDSGSGGTMSDASVDASNDATIPYYFVAIHNEPIVLQPQFDDNYAVLKEIVAKADENHIKLTIMLAPQWATYLLAASDGPASLEAWKSAGHEIAAHHHSIYHPGTWDGYTAYPPAEAQAERQCLGKVPEAHIGTLADFMTELRKLDPDIRSGCLNDEQDKNALPDAIAVDTCSGFSNTGAPGTPSGDSGPSKGRNDYVTTGSWKGISRTWLTHYWSGAGEAGAEQAFSALGPEQVYGVAFHSFEQEKDAFLAYIDFLHAKDPTGERSRTVSEVVDQNLLPEQSIDQGLLSQVRDPCDEQDGGVGPGCQQGSDCPADMVCCPPNLPCAGQCLPDCRIPNQTCPAQFPTCDQATGLCGP